MNDEIIESTIVEEEEPQIIPSQLATQPESGLLAPAGTIEELVGRYELQSEFINKVMKEGVDYGRIPGAGQKKVLLKAGAEKITTLFGLSIQFPKELQERIEDWTGEIHGFEPFFFYEDTCQLSKDGVLIAEASGSCNSWEKKYRFRQPDLKCPMCGREGTVFRSKNEGEGWFCWRKKGGCGENFPADLADIIEQDTTPVKNPFIFDLVNTFKKMSQKRALVAATLMAGNVSDHFTQDLEDMGDLGTTGGEETISDPTSVRVHFPKAKELFGGEEPTIAELFAKDPDYCDWLYTSAKGPVHDAMVAFIDGARSTERKAKDSGHQQTRLDNMANDTIGAIKNVGNILEGTKGKLSPSHYWSNVKAMGMGEVRAKEICEGLLQDDDWREALTIAYQEMRSVNEEVK